MTHLIEKYFHWNISSGNCFWHAFSVCKTIGNIFFLPTNLAMEYGITDERDVDKHFLLVI